MYPYKALVKSFDPAFNVEAFVRGNFTLCRLINEVGGRPYFVRLAMYQTRAIFLDDKVTTVI